MMKQKYSTVGGLTQVKGGNIYTLMLKKETLAEFKKFSKRYLVSESRFVEVVLKFRFEEIQSDIEVEHYHYI